MQSRTTVYIDGFNFYHGLRTASRILEPRWKKFYWLDFLRLVELILQPLESEIVSVKYFTAPPTDSAKEKRQSALLKANKYLSGDRFEIIKGKHYKKEIRCLASCREKFVIYEEKRTDVNIAMHLIADSLLGLTDNIVLISADSDLIPPLQFIQTKYPAVTVKVLFPPCRRSSEIQSLVPFTNSLTAFRTTFERAVLPDLIQSGNRSVEIPAKWKL